jgi:hypothetical protein
MNYTITIPIEVVNATHPGGYFELYLHYRAKGMTVKQAWEAVEEQLQRYGLPGRYSSFKSFLNNTWKMRSQLKEWRKTSTKNIIDIA